METKTGVPIDYEGHKESLQTRIDYFKKVVESGVWDKKELEIVADDYAAAAMFIGVKSMFLPDSGMYPPVTEIAPFEKLIEHCKQNPEAEYSKYVLDNFVVVPKIGVFNTVEIRKTISNYSDIFGFSKEQAEQITNEQISNMIVEIKGPNKPSLKLGTIIGYPPGSSLNFDVRISAIDKIDNYFEKGRDGAVKDNWNDEEVLLIDSGFGVTEKTDHTAIYHVLKKHKNNIGLTDDEAKAYSFAEGLSVFGYSFFYFPEPKNQYSERDEKLITKLKGLDKKVADFKDYIKTLRRDRSKILRGTPISIARIIWFPDETEEL